MRLPLVLRQLDCRRCFCSESMAPDIVDCRSHQTSSMSEQTHIVQITSDNPDLATLQKSWATAVFSAEDGLGPMASLHQAGDSIVALATMTEDGFMILGSGVMVGPGLMFTASHVLDEFPEKGAGPVCLTFLPCGARAWLPRGRTTLSGPSEFGPDRRRISDLTLMSCTLNSDALSESSLLLAPIQLTLPLIGDRLWAFGYRHGDIVDAAALLTPLVASGLVTGCYPQGRGERMPGSCIEVDMDTVGGMSGGPVVNDDGWVVGIVSSSLEGGPTYVTLVWDAARVSVQGAPMEIWPDGEGDLLVGRDLGLVKLKGAVERDENGNVTLTMSTPEMEQLARFSEPTDITQGRQRSSD